MCSSEVPESNIDLRQQAEVVNHTLTPLYNTQGNQEPHAAFHFIISNNPSKRSWQTHTHTKPAKVLWQQLSGPRACMQQANPLEVWTWFQKYHPYSVLRTANVAAMINSDETNVSSIFLRKNRLNCNCYVHQSGFKGSKCVCVCVCVPLLDLRVDSVLKTCRAWIHVPTWTLSFFPGLVSTNQWSPEPAEYHQMVGCPIWFESWILEVLSTEVHRLSSCTKHASSPSLSA